jgi:hypothetical protein
MRHTMRNMLRSSSIFAICSIFLGASSFLLLAAAVRAAASTPRVSRAILVPMERSLDERIQRLWADNPLALIGATRGVYLDGYGAVFTSEVNMVPEGISLMHLRLTPQDKQLVQQKQVERLPQLKKTLMQALVDSSASLDPVPGDEKIVMAVVLDHYPWEPPHVIPDQIMFQAAKSKLLEVKRAGGAGMEAAIRVTEY